MLQVTQYQKTGELRVEELPAPRLRPGAVLVRNECSLISAGTERTSVETAQASMIGKARSRPDLARQVLDNAKREGVVATYRKVQNRLDNYKELGYSSAGIVLESAVDGISPGDRVACAGTAYHAEVVSVSKNLVTPVPRSVGLDEAAFVALGAIALQGVRQADVRLGESVAVIGLGLVGLLTVQLLKAQGCRVVGLDIDDAHFALARQLGCDDCVRSDSDAPTAVESFSHGYGTDAVIITASTQSSEPLELALELARARARVVVVGAVGMNVPRSPFYEKELELRISTSYGPGRYDPLYEEQGLDYPIGHVRWTENRNMEAFLTLIAERKLDVLALVTHRIPIAQAREAYDLITGKTKEQYLAVLLEYPERPPSDSAPRIESPSTAVSTTAATAAVSAGFIGAGNFAQSYLLPALVKENVPLRGVATSRPVSASSVARKFGFAFSTTDPAAVLGDEVTNTVFVATRHDSHAGYACQALSSGRHVFVEKPLAVSAAELERVADAAVAAAEHGRYLAVGFNRRFSQPFRDVQSFFADRREPMVVTYRVNAGRIPQSSWVQSGEQGGRIVGEGCHFVDVFQALTGARPLRVYAQSARSANIEASGEDTVSIVVTYDDGSVATLIYLANGDESVPKEWCEISSGGKTAVLHNFTRVDFHSGRSSKRRKYSGGKGHTEEVADFLDVVRGRKAPTFSLESLIDTTATTFAAVESMRTNARVDL